MKVIGKRGELDAIKQALMWWNGCVFGVSIPCTRDMFDELDCLKCIELHIEWEEIKE